MRPDHSGPAARSEGRRPVVPFAWLALAAALAVLHLIEPVASLPDRFARNYNEGWNAYHAEAVLSDRPLYPDAESLFPNNYPPLSFVVVALAGGDPIRTGRVLSLIAFGVLLLEIGWIAARATGSRHLGVLAALLAASWMGAAFHDYVAMNDPQLLAHAVAVGGLALVVGERTPVRLGAGALLMLASGLVKNNLLALPLAVTLWLYTTDRRALRPWLAAAVVGGVAALALLAAVHGTSVFESMLRSRTISLALAAENAATWLPRLAAPLALGAMAAREAWRDPDARLLTLWAGLALAIGFLFAAGEGVAVNTWFELLIALALLGPWLLARLRALLPEAAQVVPLGALLLALLLDPLLQAPDRLLRLPDVLAQHARWEAGSDEDVAFLASTPDPVICETLALCFWAGKAPSVDLFNSRELFRGGHVDEETLLARVEAGEFAVVQLTALAPGRDDERVSAHLALALQRHYVVDHVGTNGVFLRPRSTPRR